MKYSYWMVEVNAENNLLTKEQIKTASEKIPDGYKITVDEPAIKISNGKAEITFTCVNKSGFKHIEVDL